MKSLRRRGVEPMQTCGQRQSRRKSSCYGLMGFLGVCVLACAWGGCTPVVAPPSNGDTGGGSGGGGTADVSGRVNSILANASLSIGDPAITIFYTVTGTPDSISVSLQCLRLISLEAMRKLHSVLRPMTASEWMLTVLFLPDLCETSNRTCMTNHRFASTARRDIAYCGSET